MLARIVVLSFAFAVLVAAPAAAKGVVSASACGADGCTKATRPLDMTLAEGGPHASAPTEASPFYVIRLRIGEPAGDHLEMAKVRTLWLPGPGLLRGDEASWMSPPPATVAALRTLVGDERPFPASRLAERAPEVGVRHDPAGGGATTDGGDGPPALLLALLGAAVLVGGVTFLTARHRRPAS